MRVIREPHKNSVVSTFSWGCESGFKPRHVDLPSRSGNARWLVKDKLDKQVDLKQLLKGFAVTVACPSF